MNLSDRTIQILKNFSLINPSLVFTTDKVLKTVAPSKVMIAIADIEEEFEFEWCIYDLSRFLSSLSLFKEPELVFNKHYVTIKEKNTSHTLNYVFTDKSVIPNLLPSNKQFANNLDILEEFELLMSLFKDVMRASSVLKLPNISIYSENNKIYISGSNLSLKDSSDTYVVEVCDTDKEFRMDYGIETFKLLDEEKYTVKIYVNEVIQLISNDIQYYIMPKAK